MAAAPFAPGQRYRSVMAGAWRLCAWLEAELLGTKDAFSATGRRV
jgi:hypothetical protein